MGRPRRPLDSISRDIITGSDLLIDGGVVAGIRAGRNQIDVATPRND